VLQHFSEDFEAGRTVAQREMMIVLQDWRLSVFTPPVFMAMFLAAASVILGPKDSSAVLANVATGLCAIAAARWAFVYPALGLLTSRLSRSHLDERMCPAPTLVILAGRIVAGVGAGMMAFALSAVSALLLVPSLAADFDAWLHLFLQLPFLILPFAACGVLAGQAVRTHDGFTSVDALGFFPAILLSGALFPLESLGVPQSSEVIFLVNPMTIMVEQIRHNLLNPVIIQDAALLVWGAPFLLMITLSAVGLCHMLQRRDPMT